MPTSANVTEAGRLLNCGALSLMSCMKMRTSTLASGIPRTIPSVAYTNNSSGWLSGARAYVCVSEGVHVIVCVRVCMSMCV